DLAHEGEQLAGLGGGETGEAGEDDLRVRLRRFLAQTNAEIIFAGFSGLTASEADELFSLVSKIRPIQPSDHIAEAAEGN
ncbi:hypothetical protein DN546_31810, partial [Burkholderia multivorans]